MAIQINKKNMLISRHRCISLFCLAVLFALSTRSVAYADITKTHFNLPPNYLSSGNGLVGYWTFDGKDMIQNVADRSGQGNNGKIIGQAATTTTLGRIGQALSFDGSDDYINLDNKTTWNLASTSHSISAWIKVSNRPATSAHIISRFTGGSPGAGYVIYIGSTGTIGVELRATTDHMYLTSTNTLNNNQWYHIVYTLSQGSLTGTGTLYIDGVSNRTDTYTGYLIDYNTILKIGSNVTLSLFNGSIDEVRIYNRALSASEILNLYNSGKVVANRTEFSNSSLTTGLIGHWTFDGKDMLQNVADKSGQGNNGKIIGQAATTTAAGKIGQALSFDGSDDYVDLGTASTYDLSSGSFTLSAWVKTTDTDGPILSRINTPTNYVGWEWNISKGASYSDPGKPSFYTDDTWISANSTVNDNKWHHIVVVHEVTGSLTTFYKDGVADGSATINNPYTTSHLLAIGLRQGDASFPQMYQGSIDDVRIYNRALSVPEILNLYNSGKVVLKQN
ncbi:MAG: LamG domain-containing protein [Candidatus Paceibacterota bacterium]|jgi:hypothetical protein